MSHFPRLFALACLVTACAVQRQPAATPNPELEVHPVGTLEGRVTSVNRAFLQSGTGGTAVVSVRLAGDPPIVVQLAPGWYMDERGLHFSREDRITVTGSQTHKKDKIEVLAHSVEKGGVSLILRDEHGRPLWQAGGPPGSATPANPKPEPTPSSGASAPTDAAAPPTAPPPSNPAGGPTTPPTAPAPSETP